MPCSNHKHGHHHKHDHHESKDETCCNHHKNKSGLPQVEEEKACCREQPPEQAAKSVTVTELELENLKKEAAEYKDKYLRLLAESENARKRMQKEKQELTQYAVQNVLVDFLNPIDHMENALNYTQQMSEEIKHWATGFQMILTQFKDVLASNGAHPFKSVGNQFDPHQHEAVEMTTTSDHPPGTVVEEHIRGYKMGDKTIRPARVIVAKSPTESVEEESIETTENQEI